MRASIVSLAACIGFVALAAPGASAGTCSASIAIVKTANISSFSASGTVVTYSYMVTNTGTVKLDPVVVSDPMVGLSSITCPSTSLAAWASETCTATYTTTTADLNAGSISNVGTATGTPPSGPNVTASNCLKIPASPAPSIAIVKTANISSFPASGTLVTYSYKVTNTGNVTLNPVVVSDPMAGLSALTCPATSLAAGANETCTATYTTTATDVTTGSITNTGTVTGTPPTGSPVTASQTLIIPLTGASPPAGPSISIVKTASVSSFSMSGTLVTYSYKVTNTGTVTFNPVVVSDPMAGLSALSCPATSLAAWASETCTATYTTTATDVTTGSITNTGTATGTPPAGSPVTASQTLTIPLTGATPSPAPSIAIVKTANISSFPASATLVTYSYKVTNTGNVTLDPVVVTDPMVGLSALSCPVTSLAAGANETCTATYTTSAANVTTGSITNTGTATGTPPTGSPVVASQTLIIPLTGASPLTGPSISIVKTANISSFSASGTLVTYSYKVTNTGTVTLSPVVVSDPMAGLSALSCPATSLAAGANETCTATYTTTVADVGTRSITNIGTATGTPPTGSPVTASQSLTVPYETTTFVSVSPPAVTHPAISLVKTPSTTTYATVGQVVTYTYVITNTGDVSLASDQYTVSDNKINGGAAFDCGAAQTLAVGASITCTNTYTITAGDLSSGTVTNSATATNGAQTSGVATATITASTTTTTTTTITTTIPSSPSTIPPTKIPSSAAPTGLGGSAKVVYNSGLLGAGGSSIVAGLVLMVFMIRRRRRA